MSLAVEREGRRREHIFSRGAYHDTLFYGLPRRVGRRFRVS
ncbi:hypothetical protein [Haladaptatus sp. W1]|nr:hypothetical protein [Haladaptatus sp. W1]